jgi:hypothetical protein
MVAAARRVRAERHGIEPEACRMSPPDAARGRA